MLQQANRAGFEPGDKTLAQVVGEAYGDEAAAILRTIREATAKQWSHTVAFRPDLSYFPAAD